MGRSAYEGVSDGQWAVFAEKVVGERDAALAELAEAKQAIVDISHAVRVGTECSSSDLPYRFTPGSAKEIIAAINDLRKENRGLEKALDLEEERIKRIAELLGVKDYIDSVGPIFAAIEAAQNCVEVLRAVWAHMPSRATTMKPRAKEALDKYDATR